MSVTQQLNILFELHDRNGGKHSIAVIGEATGVSTGTISRLRSGDIENPSLWTLQKLCDYFGIQLAYFDCQSVEECYAYLVQHNNQRYRLPTIAQILEAEGLARAEVRHVMDTIRYIKQARSYTPGE